MQTVVHFLFAEVSWRLRLGSLLVKLLAKSRRHRRIERDQYSITTLISLPTLPAALTGPQESGVCTWGVRGPGNERVEHGCRLTLGGFA